MDKLKSVFSSRLFWALLASVALLLVTAIEIFRLQWVWINVGDTPLLQGYLLPRVVTSLLLAVAGHFALSQYPRITQRLFLVLLLFNAVFFIPVLGAFSVLFVALATAWLRQPQQRLAFTHLVMPEFKLSTREPAKQFNPSGIRSTLMQTSIPSTKRLQLLIALQGVPSRISTPLLREHLEDESEDIRLIAYGLLDSREKAINAQIHREMLALRGIQDEEKRISTLQYLAELYWEMNYSRLAQGDLRLHALQQALAFTKQSLQLCYDHAGMHFLKARILLELGDHMEAAAAFEEAERLGIPESRTLPYLAEIAFARKQYAVVRCLLSRLAAYPVSPTLQNIIQLWIPHLQGNVKQPAT